MHLILYRAIMSRNVGLNYTPKNVLCEMKPKNVSIQIVVLLRKIQTSEFPICVNMYYSKSDQNLCLTVNQGVPGWLSW